MSSRYPVIVDDVLIGYIRQPSVRWELVTDDPISLNSDTLGEIVEQLKRLDKINTGEAALTSPEVNQ